MIIPTAPNTPTTPTRRTKEKSKSKSKFKLKSRSKTKSKSKTKAKTKTKTKTTTVEDTKTNENNIETEPKTTPPPTKTKAHTTATTDDSVMRRFEDLYELKGILGKGGFSTVHEGVQNRNISRRFSCGKHNAISYAVKCINDEDLSEDDQALLFQEVSILEELQHDHIIQIYDFFSTASQNASNDDNDDNNNVNNPNCANDRNNNCGNKKRAQIHYLVMEHMVGGDLNERIKRCGRYKEKDAIQLCKNMLIAVEYLHKKQVVHRDLKPHNILLTSKSKDCTNIKLADFGFAKKCYHYNSLTTLCGTPEYVAPEIWIEQPYDQRADMWSFGALLYFILSGYPLFEENSMDEKDLIEKVIHAKYKFDDKFGWDAVSVQGKHTVTKLLKVDPNVRLTASEALETTWIEQYDNDNCDKENKDGCSDNSSNHANNANKQNQNQNNKNGNSRPSPLFSIANLTRGLKHFNKTLFSANNHDIIDDEIIDDTVKETVTLTSYDEDNVLTNYFDDNVEVVKNSFNTSYSEELSKLEIVEEWTFITLPSFSSRSL